PSELSASAQKLAQTHPTSSPVATPPAIAPGFHLVPRTQILSKFWQLAETRPVGVSIFTVSPAKLAKRPAIVSLLWRCSRTSGLPTRCWNTAHGGPTAELLSKTMIATGTDCMGPPGSLHETATSSSANQAAKIAL